MLRTPRDRTVNYCTACIIGDEGSYKTLLASTFPHPYFLDVDNGAAHTNSYRFCDIPKTAAGYTSVKNEIAKLARLRPGKDGLLTHSMEGETFKVGTVVLDTLDEMQILAGMGVPTGDQRKYYRELLKRLRDEIVYPLKNINAHIIVIAHTRTWDVENDLKAAGQIAQRTLALEGSIRNALPGWFDVILHITNTSANKRMMLTQPTTRGPWRFLAKDRYHVFGGKEYEVKMSGDKPDAALAQMILERTSGGVKPTTILAERDDVKAQWMDRSKERGLMSDNPTKSEIVLLKTILGDCYTDLDTVTDGLDGLLERGLALIDNYEEDK